MNIKEIEEVLACCLDKEIIEYEMPTKEDWEELTKVTGKKFCDEFIFFIELMSRYSFPGEIYNVSRKGNKNDRIIDVYIRKLENKNWDKNMIPFYGMGHGEYFCISLYDDKVYYYYADEGDYEEYCEDFSSWIKELPEFLQ